MSSEVFTVHALLGDTSQISKKGLIFLLLHALDI